MGLSIVKAAVGFLAFAQALCVAQTYQHPHAPPTAVTPSSSYVTTDKGGAEYQHDHVLPVKRAPPTFQMSRLNDPWGSTYVCEILEPSNSGWLRSDIHQVARVGYEQVAAATKQANNIVAALWIPGRGIYLGSIPHDGGQEALRQEAKTNAPRLWSQIQDRTLTKYANGKESLYHAEDMAMFYFEDRQRPHTVTGRYPDFSYLAAYGKMPTDEKAGNQPPCSGPYARIDYSCYRVLNILDISHTK